MKAFEDFRVDRAGVAELLHSEGFRDAVQAVAEEIGATARGAGHRVTNGDPLPVDVFADPNHDRAGFTVAVRHPAGIGMEARHGVLKRAAEAAGLTVSGLEADEV
ncbi:hypothetical protein [Umezawaea sp. Da 62-37]|uniref:hypothetical protein n=1 Tax=Umezawaea sp. Da 62-37 TaxID=3075927 RepID=UPI0028F70F91|nr:hypothetical protein [Umezawaea sp. Da 62-37]WNV86570.1 hypothetical protein RM788_52080 [Umezawaea sp. Da 62-37]